MGRAPAIGCGSRGDAVLWDTLPEASDGAAGKGGGICVGGEGAADIANILKS